MADGNYLFSISAFNFKLNAIACSFIKQYLLSVIEVRTRTRNAIIETFKSVLSLNRPNIEANEQKIKSFFEDFTKVDAQRIKYTQGFIIMYRLI